MQRQLLKRELLKSLVLKASSEIIKAVIFFLTKIQMKRHMRSTNVKGR